jgi:hypothetical protein
MVLFLEDFIFLERIKERLLIFGLKVSCVDLSHFLSIVCGRDPTLFVIHFAIFVLLLFLFIGGHSNPAFLIIKRLLGL